MFADIGPTRLKSGFVTQGGDVFFLNCFARRVYLALRALFLEKSGIVAGSEFKSGMGWSVSEPSN